MAAQLTIGQCPGNSHEAGDQPGGDQQGGRVDLARNLGGDDEDARANHGTYDQGGGAGQAQSFDQLLFGVNVANGAVVLPHGLKMQAMQP